MDRHKNTYLGNTFSDSEQELEKKLLYSWHRFVHEDDESQRDDIDRIKKRIDAFIDIYEKEHVHSASRWLIWGKVAAVLTPLLVIGIVAMLLVPLKPDLNEEQYLSVITAENERATVILPDGTDVVLNSDTRLSYNPGFTKDSIRSVSLVGEAYFNVAKDTVRPFVISLDDISVRVLGTSFNVRNFPYESNVEIALEEGKVELSTHGEHIILNPGNVAHYDADSNTFIVDERGCHLATGWLRHEKTYINISPDSLMRILEHNYEVTLSADAKSGINSSFTGTLPDDNLSETLSILSEVYKFDMSNSTRKVRSTK